MFVLALLVLAITSRAMLSISEWLKRRKWRKRREEIETLI